MSSFDALIFVFLSYGVYCDTVYILEGGDDWGGAWALVM